MNDVIMQGNRDETDQEKQERLRKQAELEAKQAEDRKKSPYRSFMQVNMEAYKTEDWLIKESPSAYRVLRFISYNMDNYNALVCSYQVMQEALGYGTATIARSIKLLKEHRFIMTAKSGSTNVYFLNRELYWKSYGKNFARAEFGAKIIITASEQDNELQEASRKMVAMMEVQHENNKGDEVNKGVQGSQIAGSVGA